MLRCFSVHPFSSHIIDMLHHLTKNNSQEPPLPLQAPCWKSNTNSGAIAEPHYRECNTSSSLFGNTLHRDLINVATSRRVQTGAFSLRPRLWCFFLFYFVLFFCTLWGISANLRSAGMLLLALDQQFCQTNKKKKPFWSKETRAVQQLFPQGVSFHFLFPLCDCETCRNISSVALTWMRWNCCWDSQVDLLVTRHSDHVINVRFRRLCIFKAAFSVACSFVFPSDAVWPRMPVLVLSVPVSGIFRSHLVIRISCRRTSQRNSRSEKLPLLSPLFANLCWSLCCGIHSTQMENQICVFLVHRNLENPFRASGKCSWSDFTLNKGLMVWAAATPVCRTARVPWSPTSVTKSSSRLQLGVFGRGCQATGGTWRVDKVNNLPWSRTSAHLCWQNMR